jgi:hypothetical protein
MHCIKARLSTWFSGDNRQRKLLEIAEGNVGNNFPIQSRGSSRQLSMPAGNNWASSAAVAEQPAQPSGHSPSGVPAPPQSFGTKPPVRRELQYTPDECVEIPSSGDAGKSRRGNMPSVKGRRLSKDSSGGGSGDLKGERSRSRGPSRTQTQV